MSSPVIEIRGLSKAYGKVRALDGLDLTLQPGPIGLLGPNGAGKTTLLKLLLGLLTPDAGSARIAGCDPSLAADRMRLRRAVGYMPEGDCLIPGMSAVELTATLGRLSGLTSSDALTRAHEVLDYVGLDESRYRPADGYSTGMKQRLKLAQALVHDPEIVLLDEPTNGLDPKARRQMLELVHDLGHVQEKNVLVCSHLLPDVERTCRDVVVLRQGRVQLSGNIEALTASEGRRISLEVRGDASAFRAALERKGWTSDAGSEARLVVQAPDELADADELFALARETGIRITALTERRATLEQVFMDGVTGAMPLLSGEERRA